ncbi:hypothetical protein ACTFIW_000395 [Dictyostelium discoideum]
MSQRSRFFKKTSKYIDNKYIDEPYKSLDLESFCSEYQIKDQNGLISETTANHFKNVSQLNPLFGYIDFHTQIGSAGNASVFEGTYKSMSALFFSNISIQIY